MKILWFTNTPANAAKYLNDGPVSGGWLQSLDLSLQQHVELHVAFYYHRKDSEFKYGNTTYHPINPPNWKLQTIKNNLFLRVIDKEDLPVYLKIIEHVKPDLIHIHGTENPFRCIIGHVNIPVVVSIQGNVTIAMRKYTGGLELNYLAAHDFNMQNGLKSMLFTNSFKNELKLAQKRSVFELRDFRYIRNVIGRTAWDKRITSIMAPGRNYYHNDEILRDIFYSVKWESPSYNNKLIIHTTLCNSPSKGFETICEAIFELKQSGISDLEWRVAGISESDLIVKIIKKKLKDRMPSSGLVFLGNLNEKQLVEKMKEANMYVMASHIENSSNSLCEAMILGMPCIATYAGGTASLLKDNEDGILIQDGDPWSLSGAILELYNNPQKAVDYGKNARNKALIRHDKERIATDLLAIYRTISNN
jgi:glycosyltransferase involved in cell wall biosynthesis